MRTAAPASVVPFRKRRLEIRDRLVITCDIRLLPRPGREFAVYRHAYYKILKTEAGSAKVRENVRKNRPIAGRFKAAGDIPEVLFDDALLTDRAFRQNRTQLLRR